jgi:hypothetical protein
MTSLPPRFVLKYLPLKHFSQQPVKIHFLEFILFISMGYLKRLPVPIILMSNDEVTDSMVSYNGVCKGTGLLLIQVGFRNLPDRRGYNLLLSRSSDMDLKDTHIVYIHDVCIFQIQPGRPAK